MNKEFKLLLLLGVLVLIMKKDVFIPRGIRNNNPGNIKELKGDGTVWLGERATDDDEVFEEFTSALYGIRALARILKNYKNLYNLTTIEQIISRWAPGNENDTQSYINFVVNYMSIPANEYLMESDYFMLIKAIIRYENGIQPYSDNTIKSALALA